MKYAAGGSLRVLFVEDSPTDMQLALHALRALDRPIEAHRVASESELRHALDDFHPELVLSDFSMPGFDGMQALSLCRELAPEAPFLFLSGTIGEQRAVEAVRAGAVDYVLKDSMKRLPVAVNNALAHVADDNEKRRIMRDLAQSEERLRHVAENAGDWIWEMSLDGRSVYNSRGLATILGYSPEETVGRDLFELMTEESRREVQARLPKLIAERRGWRGLTLTWRHRDGGVRWLESNATPVLDASGALIAYRGVDRDVTQHEHHERRVRRHARIQGVLAAINAAIARARDRDTLYADACGALVAQGGYVAVWLGVVDEKGMLRLVAARGDPSFTARIADMFPVAIDGDPAVQTRPSVRAIREGRTVVVPDLTAEPGKAQLHDVFRRIGAIACLALPLGQPAWGVLMVCANDTEQLGPEDVVLLERLVADLAAARDLIAQAERLEFLAFHNPVTHFPNRAAFLEHLRTALSRGPLAVGVIDPHGFRFVNQARGRALGDLLLRDLAVRLGEWLPAGGFLAHLEADCFAFALPGGDGPTQLAQADTLLGRASAAPFIVGGETLQVTLRAGLCHGARHRADAETLLNHADFALRVAKRGGRALAVFDSAMARDANKRVTRERELRVALDSRQFILHYQPKYCIDPRRLAGLEGLARWLHPQRGLVGPAEFIDVLEDTGGIVELGRQVVEIALRDARAWHAAGLDPPRIAVNVSTRQLREPQLVAEFGATLARFPEVRHLLDLELTESVMMDDVERNIATLIALRALGPRIVLDDFGTGYSSLAYLGRLPLDALKIDRAFVSPIAEDPQAVALVTSVIGLAHSMGRKVVAEGVETEAQLNLLRLLRCDEAQGYFLARPMSPEKVAALLAARRPQA